jgi:predicted aminopeptidase
MAPMPSVPRFVASLLRPRRLFIAAAAVVVAAAVGGCSTLGYYAQSISGHLAMMRSARPIEEVVADAGTPEALKKRLLRAQEIRVFASS